MNRAELHQIIRETLRRLVLRHFMAPLGRPANDNEKAA